MLDDIFAEASFLAKGYTDMVSEFDAYLAPNWHGDLVGPDPGAGGKKNRTQRTAAIGVQKNTHLSRDGLQRLIPEPRLGPLEHVDAAQKVLHPFANSPELPLDVKFAAERSASSPDETAVLRAQKLKRLRRLAKECEELDLRARSRMSPEVKVTSSTINLGFLSVLIHLIRWPDWQLPALFTRGFKVAGDIEALNVCPRVASAAVESEHSLLDATAAEKWNESLANGSRPSDLDEDVYETATEQSKRGLLSKPMSKAQVDLFFGRGCWKGIRRRGINQHGKCRGIDNARSSRTNFAAWLEETISTAPQDIGIQIVCWLFQGKSGRKRFEEVKKFLRVYLGADDLQDAYHGCPNDTTQLCFCVVAIMNPRTKKVEFYISYTHLFGLSAAVVNLNRLPELLTAVARRIGIAPPWHFFDDQGTLDFAEKEGRVGNRKAATQSSPKSARCRPQAFVQELFKLAGRPFKESKHQAPCQRQVHLGLLNDFIEFQNGSISIKPRVGKIGELILILQEMKAREPRNASAAEVLHLAGSMVFLLYSCFDKVARGASGPFTIGSLTTSTVRLSGALRTDTWLSHHR